MCIAHTRVLVMSSNQSFLYFLNQNSMKKTSFFRLIALLAFFSLNFVQVSLLAQNTWGVRVGTQFCSFRSTSKDLENMQKPSPKLLVAVPLTFGVSDNFGVQIEPSFVQKGTKIVFNGAESGVLIRASSPALLIIWSYQYSHASILDDLWRGLALWSVRLWGMV